MDAPYGLAHNALPFELIKPCRENKRKSCACSQNSESILARQRQRVVAEIEPDARRGEIGPLNLLGIEPVAIAVVADQDCTAASRHDKFPILEILFSELGGMLLGEGDLVDQPVRAHRVGDVFDALGADYVTYHGVTIKPF